MSQITYAVKAVVIRNTSHLIDGQTKLRVMSAAAEAPPLSFMDDNHEYILSRTKTLRKGVFSGTLGGIVVSTAQTKALMLSPPSPSTCTAVSTMATLNLLFYPRHILSVPPKLGRVITKIKASTFFSLVPSDSSPSFSEQYGEVTGRCGV